ncbi:MAG: archaeosine biosynthesis radical SAM protein RaSEA [Candidatus Lokiarchaeota archaeon]|nr:archaeosine biosynthesis radical SAM protein RaSEA [Candidatus Lokiarchaeota archaeon]
MKKHDNHECQLTEKILNFRLKALRKRKVHSKEQLSKPVSFWIREDRLHDGPGKELTIILRTSGCRWALGEYGGCSMCGYIQDASTMELSEFDLIKQFDYALESKAEEIERDSSDYVIKIFNSGSFFDELEINPLVRKHIYKRIAESDKFKEVVVESRVEFVNAEILKEIRECLNDKRVEIAIGLETANDHVRNAYINKGLLLEDFKQIILMCKRFKIGIKAYLLFKPPFLTEQSAIDDCVDSIRTCIDLGVNTISINPVNIQVGSLLEQLWKQKKYRPPWFYSLFSCLKKALTAEDLKKTLIVSDPSGAGSQRGIHNCTNRECNSNMIDLLKKFVSTQDISVLANDYHQCKCSFSYETQKNCH